MSAVPQTLCDHQPVGGREAADLFAALAGEPALLVAVSGGPDSVALLALLTEWGREPGRPALHAATVDHGLRAASDKEAKGVATLCGTLGVPHRILRWQGAKPRTALQEQAGEARYALLVAEAERLGGATLVTAHTQDDQAETLLMRMARGSGPAGLAGMRTRSRKGAIALVRPLLDLPKARLVATAQARGLPVVNDPSNSDSRFGRVRWRALMPALADQGLDSERLALLARRIARLDAAAAARAASLLTDLLLPPGEAPVVQLRFSALLAEPDEIVLRVVALALQAVPGIEVPARLERLEACVDALSRAARDAARTTRTLAGCVVILQADGTLALRPEGPRRRGVHPAAS